MFQDTAYNATSFSLDLSSWNTESANNMFWMFNRCGYSSSTFNLNIGNFNTSKVTSMSDMFSSAGYNATTWNVTIPLTNGNGISNTTERLYGRSTSVYINSRSARTGRLFTLNG